MKKNVLSFLTPEFIKGVSTLIDIGASGVKFQKIKDFNDDSRTLRSDWNQVGDDLRGGINEFRKGIRTGTRRAI